MDFLRSHDLRFGKETLQKIGLTRLINLTPLDVLGIPIWGAVRPQIDQPSINISVYNGGGLTHRIARTGAIMEAVERRCAERPFANIPLRVATMRAMRSEKLDFVPPHEFHLVEGSSPCKDHEKLEWTQATNLVDRRKFWIPANAVLCPYVPPQGVRDLGIWNGNGLASSFSRDTAHISALLELIERDHVCLTRVNESESDVDLSEVFSGIVGKLVRKLNKVGVSVVIKDVTGDFEIPTFMASTDDPHGKRPYLLNSGYGVHWNPEIAMLKAILESVQSRLITIQGAREDSDFYYYRGQNSDYSRFKKVTQRYFYEPSGRKSDLSRFKKLDFKSSRHALRYLLNLISRKGFSKILSVDLTDPHLGFPVVRTLVPGMEQHEHYTYRRKGRRLKQAIRNWFKRHANDT